MACIRKRRGKYVLDYRDQQGCRHWETTQGSKKEAERLLAQRLIAIGSGDYQSLTEQRTFEGLVAAYTAGHLAVNVRDTTRADYEATIRLHLTPHLGTLKARSITPETVERWRAVLIEKECGRRTINKAHTLLGSILRYGLRHRWVTVNAASVVPKLREAGNHHERAMEANVLTPPEIRRLVAAAEERYRLIIMTAIYTGLREGELLGLGWDDVDFQGRQLIVRRTLNKNGRFYEPKTRASRRRVAIPVSLVLELKRWKLACPKGEIDIVFPNASGGLENQSNLLKRGFFPALRRAGLRHIRFHDLRHTYASLLVALDVHPKRIQALMGHSSIKITMDTYGHLMHETDSDAAEKIAEAVASGSNLVATAECQPADLTQVTEWNGAGNRSRTDDLLITKQING
jgi:integrase